MAEIKFGLKKTGQKIVVTPADVTLEPGDRLKFDGGSDDKGNKKVVLIVPNDNVVSVHADIKFPMSAIEVKDVKVGGKEHDFEVSFKDPGGSDEDGGGH